MDVNSIPLTFYLSNMSGISHHPQRSTSSMQSKSRSEVTNGCWGAFTATHLLLRAIREVWAEFGCHRGSSYDHMATSRPQPDGCKGPSAGTWRQMFNMYPQGEVLRRRSTIYFLTHCLGRAGCCLECFRFLCRHNIWVLVQKPKRQLLQHLTLGNINVLFCKPLFLFKQKGAAIQELHLKKTKISHKFRSGTFWTKNKSSRVTIWTKFYC